MDRKVPNIFILLFLSTVLFLATQPARADDLKKKTNSGSVNPVMSPVVDLGIINIDGGMVERVFELYNGESEELVLKGAFTSCACTKAFIELPDGTISKPFGMSLPRNWYRVIKPGERFKVHLEFDPLYHGKDGFGPFRRNVYLITSASPDDNMSSTLPVVRYGSVTTLVISGEVVTAADYNAMQPVQSFNVSRGDFRFASEDTDFGIVKQSGGIVSYDLALRYDGDGPVKVTGTPTSCGCVSASISKDVLEPGDRAVLTIRFDPNYHEEPKGRFFKDVVILTDPPQPKEVGYRIWAQVDLDLGPGAYKFKEHDDEDEHEEEEETHR